MAKKEIVEEIAAVLPIKLLEQIQPVAGLRIGLVLDLVHQGTDQMPTEPTERPRLPVGV